MAHGLKPSSSPMTRVKSGRPSSRALSRPKAPVSTLSSQRLRIQEGPDLAARGFVVEEPDDQLVTEIEGRHAEGPYTLTRGEREEALVRREVAVHRTFQDDEIRALLLEVVQELPGATAVRAAGPGEELDVRRGGGRRPRGGQRREGEPERQGDPGQGLHDVSSKDRSRAESSWPCRVSSRAERLLEQVP